MTTQPPSDQNPHPDSEFVWSYRGYHLRSSEFTTAMVHYFRAEVQRSNVWRQRLDTTTNWAVVSIGAALTVAFSPTGHHGIMMLNTLLVTLFLSIEARRYQYYELWSSRVRLMETDFFAAMLVPPFGPAPDWAENLAESLLQPHYPISSWEALGRRYRRNYFWMFSMIFLAWLTRLWLTPSPAYSMDILLERASLGNVPGSMVLGIFLAYNVAWMLLGLLTVSLQQASGEVLPRFDLGEQSILSGASSQWKVWFRHGQLRRQLLALVITDKAQPVADVVLKEMKRGVTALDATGMFSGKQHKMLLCALTATEVNHLKALVLQQDPDAFVIVTPAQEVLGRGFMPLNKKS